ncbi:TetR/AcrR family transcriptional regulator [Pontibacter sp. E15-1]|uniref:TetR/AcrR family transcriptional regulator n=1 Tax=Pontibacter sp. E15-1 TaxID=2919918 RepID=UPI001F4F7B31|nr:TetR/AcrR family transcriptional regulator [Pontibacter sp. E15-1]MCJ8165435.1 TetR/AcrR family transcriptional regulator [Pontibacter sp. E15-1]
METAEKTDTKARIMQAAFGLFCQRGIKSVSMDDIAQHLAMSKKTLYKWFANKDQVVYEAMENYLGSIQQDCEVFVEKSGNAIEEIFQVMALTKQVFSRIHPSIFHDLQKYHSTSWELWQQHKNSFMLGKVKANLRRGMAEGLFRKELDVSVIAQVRLSLIELPFNKSVFPPHEYDISRVQLAVLEHYMLGIATLKGHKLINELQHIKEEE